MKRNVEKKMGVGERWERSDKGMKAAGRYRKRAVAIYLMRRSLASEPRRCRARTDRVQKTSVRPLGNWHYCVFRVRRTRTNNAMTFGSLEASRDIGPTGSPRHLVGIGNGSHSCTTLVGARREKGHADLWPPACSKKDVVSIGRGVWMRSRTAVCDDSADAGPYAHPITVVGAAAPI